RIWVGVLIDGDPASAGDQQKQGQGMVGYCFPERASQIERGLPAFCGASFIKVLGGQHRHYHSRPVGNGVSKKRSPVSSGIRPGIEDNPKDEDADARDTQRMMRQETFLTGLSLPGSLPAIATFWHHGNQFKPYSRVTIRSRSLRSLRSG